MCCLGKLLVVVLVLGALSGCAKEGDPEDVLSSPVVVADVSGASALDAVAADELASYDESEQKLAALIISPHALDEDLQLVALQIDDPNGTGRIDGRWYPPRVLRNECAINVDQAPLPTAATAFIPGDPDTLFGGASMDTPGAILRASYTVSITVQLFDEPSQRAELISTMGEFYDAMGEGLECDSIGATGGNLTDALLGDFERFEPIDVGYPGYGIETNSMTGHGRANVYSIGDRVLLTVAINEPSDLLDAEGPSLDASLARRVILAEIARLESQGFA